MTSGSRLAMPAACRGNPDRASPVGVADPPGALVELKLARAHPDQYELVKDAYDPAGLVAQPVPRRNCHDIART